MREFALLVPSKIISSEEFGIVTRFVVGGMLLSHGVRPDARLHIIFDESICITFDGKSMRNVRPDEQSLSGILRAGFERGAGRVMAGIFAKRIDLGEFLKSPRGAKLYYSGAYGRVEDFPKDFFVVFSYPNLRTEERLCKAGFLSVNLGKRDLFPDQAVVVLNNKVDRKST
ncbi:MAG: hypothetical protein QXZ28_04820 [Candidatus Methanomethylicaceae archaeon]